MRTHRICLLLVLYSFTATAEDASPASDKFIAQRVQEMFQIGFVRGPREIQECQQLYDSLRKTSGGNSLIDYAHGLVCLRQLKNKDATNDFLAATKHPGRPYLPAWRALIWSHFAAKDDDVAYERLLEFTSLVQKSDDLTAPMQQEEVYWIGRIMAAVDVTSETKHRRERWAQYEKHLTDLLDTDVIRVYRGGKDEMYIRHALLEEEIVKTQERAKKKDVDQRQKKLDRLGKSVIAADKKREALKKSAEELKDSLEEQKEEFKKQIDRTQKDYNFLERRAMTLMSAMVVLDQEIMAQQPRAANLPQNSARGQALAALREARSGYELEYMRIASLVQQTSANAQMLNEQNGQFFDQYQEANNELIKDGAATEERKKQALKQAELLKTESPKSKPPVATNAGAAKSFRAHIDLDLFAERDRVLKSLGVPTETK